MPGGEIQIFSIYAFGVKKLPICLKNKTEPLRPHIKANFQCFQNLDIKVGLENLLKINIGRKFNDFLINKDFFEKINAINEMILKVKSTKLKLRVCVP